jgi:creatinine amidohydrolase
MKFESGKTVRLGEMTRREYREAVAAGGFSACIIPTGAIEQHLEHLEMQHDIRTCTWLAEQVAGRLYPDVIVAPPMNVGISEHHMIHKGTLTAKPGSWLAVLFDAIESMVRHGCRQVLVLNGHGGNDRPVMGILNQWRLYFENMHPGVDLQFHSYWNLSRAEAEAVATTGVPGHATEYETSMALALFPESVRHDAMEDQEDRMPLAATVEKGERLVEITLNKVTEYLQGMIAGGNPA